MKKIICINAGPRKGHNTDQLIKACGKGAIDNGYSIEYIDLYDLDKYSGCVSCFACKQDFSYGKCAVRDGLYDVLNKIREADGLIIGSPNYLGNLTAAFRALYERLVFQSLTYNKETPCCNKHQIPVILIMTSNCAEEQYDKVGYTVLLEQYKKTLSTYVGPTKILTCGNTVQVDDYSRYNWTMFDPEAKRKHHDETFTDYLNKAYQLGRSL